MILDALETRHPKIKAARKELFHLFLGYSVEAVMGDCVKSEIVRYISEEKFDPEKAWFHKEGYEVYEEIWKEIDRRELDETCLIRPPDPTDPRFLAPGETPFEGGSDELLALIQEACHPHESETSHESEPQTSQDEAAESQPERPES